MSAERWKYDGSMRCAKCGIGPAVWLSRSSYDPGDVKADLEFVAAVAAAGEPQPDPLFRSPIYVEIPCCETCFDKIRADAAAHDAIHVGYSLAEELDNDELDQVDEELDDRQAPGADQ